MNRKSIVFLLIVGVVALLTVWSFLFDVSTAQLKITKTYTDQSTGLLFNYPGKFDLETSVGVDGKKDIVLDPFGSEPEDRGIDASSRLLRFMFLNGETLEGKTADYSKKEYALENVQIDDIVVNGMHGKRVSYLTPIGLNQTNILLEWGSSPLLLVISYGPNSPLDAIDRAYEKIIASVQNLKR